MSHTTQFALAHRAAAYPDEIAICEGASRMTWKALYEGTLKRAAELRLLPLAEGFIAVGMRPSAEFAQWLHAAILEGASLLLLNPEISAEDLRYVSDTVPIVGWLGFSTRVDGANGSVWPTQRLNGNAAAFSVALLTSGTTGRPKIARLGWTQFATHAEASRKHLGLGPDDVWLTCLPVHHVGGLSIFTRAAVLGCRIVIQSSFDPAAVWRSLQEESITHLSLVPTQLKRLLDAQPNTPFPEGVRCVLVGGAALPETLAAQARALRIPLAPTYGLTEACSQVTTLRPGEFLGGRMSSGTPLGCVQVRIVGPEGLDCGEGVEGEIAVRGPTVFEGYIGQALPADGWFATGDYGVLRDGELVVLDRRTDLIVTGGENVYPSRVEEVLRRHPGVRDCAVVGVPDDEWGQRVTAVIDPGDSPVDEPALRELCRRALARHEVPKAFVAMRALPRTASGKIRRDAVRRQVFTLDMGRL